jgi:hypothetical protein
MDANRCKTAPGTSRKICGLILTNTPGDMVAVNPAMPLISSREAGRFHVGRWDMEATTLRSRYPRYLKMCGRGVVRDASRSLGQLDMKEGVSTS